KVFSETGKLRKQLPDLSSQSSVECRGDTPSLERANPNACVPANYLRMLLLAKNLNLKRSQRPEAYEVVPCQYCRPPLEHEPSRPGDPTQAPAITPDRLRERSRAQVSPGPPSAESASHARFLFR